MNFLINVIKGIMIGIANVIPGVSGGTMAVSLGIYDKMIEAVSGLFHHLLSSIRTLLPILIGGLIGLAGFSYMVEYLLTRHTYVTCMAFIGMILGGLPTILHGLSGKMKENHHQIGISGVICFVLLFLFSVALPLLSSDQQVIRSLSITPGSMILLFFLGVIASATMIIPGVSGSMVLMILGYYYSIIALVKNSVDALRLGDLAGLFHSLILIAPFGIGVLLGVFLIARLITFLFQRYGVQTYCAILGLVLSSPFAIAYNTGMLTALSALSPLILLLGLAVLILGALITWKLGNVEG